MCKSFTHFFNKKYWHIWDINCWNFNVTLTNNIVSFEQPGPGLSYPVIIINTKWKKKNNQDDDIKPNNKHKQNVISTGNYMNQLLQLCTARTDWSESDQAVRTVHSGNSWWLALLWSDSVIKLVSVLFSKCTTLVGTKCWPMVIRQPYGDQWKAEKLGAFWRWPITRCLIKSDSS